MISKDWTILSIVFPLYSWCRSQDGVIEKIILYEAARYFGNEGNIQQGDQSSPDQRCHEGVGAR